MPDSNIPSHEMGHEAGQSRPSSRHSNSNGSRVSSRPSSRQSLGYSDGGLNAFRAARPGSRPASRGSIIEDRQVRGKEPLPSADSVILKCLQGWEALNPKNPVELYGFRVSLKARQRWKAAYRKIVFGNAFYTYRLKMQHARIVMQQVEVAKKRLKLDLGGVGIKSVPENAFEWPKLKTIWLHENQISKLPDSIGGLVELTQLRLYGNRLKMLPDTVSNLCALQLLWLQNNHLRSLPTGVGCLSSLTILDISDNPKLSEIPVELCQCAILNTLNTDPLLHFPPRDVISLGTQRCLNYMKRFLDSRESRKLDLHGMGVSTMPPEISTISPHITSLDLTGCQVRSLPPEVGLLSDLQEMSVDAQKMVTPPTSVLSQGVEATVRFLHAIYVAKLDMVLRQPGVGLHAVPQDLIHLPNLMCLDISRNSVTLIPSSATMCSKLQVFDCSGNGIHQIMPDFATLQNLVWLSLHDNSLKRADPSIFTCTSLTCLYLSSNRLESIPESFTQLNKLLIFTINHNQLSELPTGFDKLEQLEQLDIGVNCFSEISFDIGLCARLKEFKFDGAPLKSPPFEILQLAPEAVLHYLGSVEQGIRSTEMQLNGVGLTAVPYEVYQQTHLLSLNLQGNQLTNLPTEFGFMTKLTNLNLSHNQLAECPHALTRLVRVTELDLSFNKITTLPPQLGFLRMLRHLGVEGNRLVQPPVEIARRGMKAILAFLKALGAAPNTGAVRLSHMRLRAFPMAVLLLGAASLQELDLSHNVVAHLPDRFGSVLSSIRTLNLSYNQLAALPDTFSCMVCLQSLNLSCNALTSVNPGIGACTRMERLLLSSNSPLEGLPEDMGNMSSLTELQINNCSLKSVPLRLGSLRVLARLGVSHNRDLSVLPGTMGRATSLEKLAFSNCCLRSLPYWLSELPVLGDVEWGGNPLQRPPQEILDLGVSHVIEYLKRFLLARRNQMLDVSRLDLTMVPLEVQDRFIGSFGIASLKLDENLIKILPPEMFTLESLAELSAGNCRVKFIPTELTKLTNLTCLQLHGNRLRVIPQWLGKMTHIRRFTLAGNKKLTTPPQSLWTLPTARLLDFFRRCISAAPTGRLDWSGLFLGSMDVLYTEVVGWWKIHTLMLDECSLSVVNNDLLNKLTDLHTLSLAHNFLTEFNVESVMALTGLQSLSLSHNRIRRLPWEFAYLTNLTALDIRSNPWFQPPKEIRQADCSVLLAYQQAFLSSFQASTVFDPDSGLDRETLPKFPVAGTCPDGFINSPSSLSLNRFQLLSFPEEIWELSLLTHLFLCGNKLADIPQKLSQFSMLETLDLSFNRLPSLNAWIPYKFPKLKSLNLTNNRITAIPIDYGACSNLQSMQLGSNPLRQPEQWLVSQGTGRMLLFLSAFLCARDGLSTLELMCPQAVRELVLVPPCVQQRKQSEEALISGAMDSEKSETEENMKKLPAECRTNEGVTGVLVLSNWNLHDLPPEWNSLSDVQSLCLEHNFLSVWPQLPDAGMSCITALDLTSNSIEIIPEDIQLLIALKALHVSHNQLSYLPVQIWKLPSLRILDISHNHIASIGNVIKSATTLRSLNLTGNKIKVLVDEFGVLTGLMELKYAANPIEQPHESILAQGWNTVRSYLARLLDAHVSQQLSVPSFKLAAVAAEILHVQHVSEADASNNELEELPVLIGSWGAHLTHHMWLHHNHIKSLPVEIKAWVNLIELRIDHNKLQYLPPAMTCLHSLRRLIAGHNRLLEMPLGLGYLPELSVISMECNKLSSLPFDLCASSSLTQLSVDDNPVRTPPQSVVLAGLRQIMSFLKRMEEASSSYILDLRSLQLEAIDYEVMPVPGIKQLLLQENKIRTLSQMPLHDVEKIDMHNNPLESLDPIVTATSIQQLKVSHSGHSQEDSDSRLSSIPPGLSALQSLQLLDVTYNMIHSLPPSLVFVTSLTALKLSHNRLKELPSGMRQLQLLKILEISFNPIVIIPVELGLLTLLRRLRFDECPIESPCRAIAQQGVAVTLQYLHRLCNAQEKTGCLDLSGLALTDVPEEVAIITSLRELKIENSGLQKIPSGLLSMRNLEQLWLVRNNIPDIPEGLFELDHLVRLRLSFNPISKISPSISKLTRLSELWLEGCEIRFLPVSMGLLSTLQTVRLDTEKLISPPPSVADAGARLLVKYLYGLFSASRSKQLDVSYMALTAFPMEVFDVKDLRVLDISGNYIHQLPEEITQLQHLEVLKAEAVPVSDFPFQLGGMTSLISLHITAGPQLTCPPTEVCKLAPNAGLQFLQKLYKAQFSRRLDLSSSGITSTPGMAVSLPGLKHLDLSANPIVVLPPSIGISSSLESLRLTDLPLASLPVELGNLCSITTLRLNRCELKTMPICLSMLGQLRRLSIPDNGMQRIPAGVFEGMSSLQKLNLDRNALTCIPDSIGSLLQLRKLRICGNQLSQLPIGMSCLTSMTMLAASCNLLFDLPEELDALSNLTALHLSANQIRNIPRCLERLPSLRCLWLSNNQLAGLSARMGLLTNLVDLQASGNPALQYPPPSITMQGTQVIVEYLASNMGYEVSVGT